MNRDAPAGRAASPFQVTCKATAPPSRARCCSWSDQVAPPTPLRGFCLRFGLGEGRGAVAGNRRLIAGTRPAMLRDPRLDSAPAGPVPEALRHERLLSLLTLLRAQPGHSDRPVQAARV